MAGIRAPAGYLSDDPRYHCRFYGHALFAAAHGSFGCRKIDHDSFVAMVQKAFVTFPDHAPIDTVPMRYAGGDLYVERDLEQVHVVMGLPSIAYGAEEIL